jgi:hypothetical protein
MSEPRTYHRFSRLARSLRSVARTPPGSGFFKVFGALLTVGLSSAGAPLAAAQEITLYENDFESPNQPVSVSCGNSLDQTGVNETYGKAGYNFIEQFTVETIVLDDPAGKYSGQGDENGKYALGMLGMVQDDRLALRFDVMGQQFLNVAMDVSSIDVDGCGGPFGVETPKFKVSLLDDSGGEFSWTAKPLDEKTLEGEASNSPWSFHWSRGTVALDASKATNGSVVVVFDLVSNGYAAFDNLKITASKLAAVGDRDADGVEDSKDNCPGAANPSQANADEDAAGDACDPAPKDPTECGDRSGDGDDDCSDWCETHESNACSMIAGGSGVAGRGGRAGSGGAGAKDAGESDGGEPDDDDDDRPSSRGSTGSRGSSKSNSETEGCSVRMVGAAPGSTDPTGLALFIVCAVGALGVIRVRRKR